MSSTVVAHPVPSQAQNPTAERTRPSLNSMSKSSSASVKAKLTPDEAIKAEEDALKSLEASVAPLRKAKNVQTPAQSSPLQSPLSSPVRQPAQTPKKTPMPLVTNSLVNGATPRTVNRFSPMRFLGTPRVPSGIPSGLRSVARNDGDDDEKRTIFGKSSSGRRASARTRSSVPVMPTLGFSGSEAENEEIVEAPSEDDTVKIAAPFELSMPEDKRAVMPSSGNLEHAEVPPSPLPSSAASWPPDIAKKVEGVEVELESVKSAVVSHQAAYAH